jgi:hypothetical protein
MSNYSPKTYSCSHCSYQTSRKYNLERHSSLVHNIVYDGDAPNVQVDPQKVQGAPQKVQGAPQKVQGVPQKVQGAPQKVQMRLKCDHCYKVFSRSDNLKRHMNACKGVTDPLECYMCHQLFASKSSLSGHRKVCKGQTNDNDIGDSVASITNITHNNNTHHGDVNNITNNNITNIHVMNFPNGIEDQDFRFYKGHISEKRFKKLVTNCKPMTAFRNYARELLSHEANHVAFKTSPNVTYSKVKREDGWEFEQDSEVIPVLTYHASCSALEDTHAAFENAKTNPQSKGFVQVLDDINTENDENTNYEDANDSVKFCIINTSLRSRVKPSDTLRSPE